MSLEQCSSEITAKFKSKLFSGKRVVDLTRGAGVVSAFFSSYFDEVLFVETDAQLVEIAKHNYNILGISNIALFHQAAERFIQNAFRPGLY